MNLRTIPELALRFDMPIGLSDHTMAIAAPVAAVALGACIIEKHLTLSRSTRGPDSAFSLEPQEFKAMVDAVRTAEKALGDVHFGLSTREESSRVFRRSLFVVQDVKRGERFTSENVRSIRPGYGLHTRHLHPAILNEARLSVGNWFQFMRLTSPLLKRTVYPCSLLSFGNSYPSIVDRKRKNLFSKAVPFFGLPPCSG